MYGLVITALLVALVFMSGVAFYFFQMSSGKGSRGEPQPFNQFLLGVLAAAFALLIVFLFYLFVDREFEIAKNMGQVGDFVGGLTNPVLSFLALLVLLRTTLIQTTEARKTTNFMQSQQKILEMERFDSTFFQLVDRLDQYCDSHLRVMGGSDKGVAVGLKFSDVVVSRRHEFDQLPGFDQYVAARQLANDSVRNDTCVGFSYRAIRVVAYVDDSTMDVDVKKTYMGILRDTMLPDERIILATLAFFYSDGDRELIRKWDVDSLLSDYYICKIVADYYQGSEEIRAWVVQNKES